MVTVGDDEPVARNDALGEPDAVANADDVPVCDIVPLTHPLPDTLADRVTADAVAHALAAADALEHRDAGGDADVLPLTDVLLEDVVLLDGNADEVAVTEADRDSRPDAVTSADWEASVEAVPGGVIVLCGVRVPEGVGDAVVNDEGVSPRLAEFAGDADGD